MIFTILLGMLILWTGWNFLGKIIGGVQYHIFSLGTDLVIMFVWIVYGAFQFWSRL
jgi:hypothetical protein